MFGTFEYQGNRRHQVDEEEQCLARHVLPDLRQSHGEEAQ
jgi:hypothetical protein